MLCAELTTDGFVHVVDTGTTCAIQLFESGDPMSIAAIFDPMALGPDYHQLLVQFFAYGLGMVLTPYLAAWGFGSVINFFSYKGD